MIWAYTRILGSQAKDHHDAYVVFGPVTPFHKIHGVDLVALQAGSSVHLLATRFTHPEVTEFTKFTAAEMAEGFLEFSTNVHEDLQSCKSITGVTIEEMQLWQEADNIAVMPASTFFATSAEEPTEEDQGASQPPAE